MRIRVLATALFAVVLASAPVLTITNGQPDGDAHPYVGLAFQPIPNSEFVTICSGSALSPTKFLTAAHCFDPTRPVIVTFDSDPLRTTEPDPLFTLGTFHPDPAWCPACGHGLPGFDTHDVAVITLSAPVTLSRYAHLPEPAIVDTLPMKTGVDIVGYGVQEIIRGGGRPQPFTSLVRCFAPSQIIQSNNRISVEFLKLTANPSKGKGGICSGDSGGPDLLGGTDTVLAVNSFVTNGNCAGVTYSQRVDLPDILQFIASVQ
jgi:hypothetical protein